MSIAPIPLLQRLFPRSAREPEQLNGSAETSAERLAHVAVCANYGYFNMSCTPLMFPFVAEMRID